MARHRLFVRLLCLVGPTLVLLAAPCFRALAAPGDTMLANGPGLKNPEAPDATPAAHKYSVDTKSGALMYNYPLVVPPGRNGMTPQLALSYSSNGGLRGGIASAGSSMFP